jgi:hypothetical protein
MGAILDLELGSLLGGGGGGGRVLGGLGSCEAEVLGRDGEEEAFDGVEGAVGEDVDGVDDVVDQRLFGRRGQQSHQANSREKELTTGG